MKYPSSICWLFFIVYFYTIIHLIDYLIIKYLNSTSYPHGLRIILVFIFYCTIYIVTPAGWNNRPFSISLTRWFRWLVDFWKKQGRGCFFPLWRLGRPRHDGERAWPLAKMLLGAKLGGRPPIVSRIIVHEYCALWVFPDYSTAKFYLPSRTQERTV